MLPEADLDFIFESTAPLWEEFRGGRLFITGGTGFFGRWLLESFVAANDRLKLKAQATVLTRSTAAFQKSAPELTSHHSISLLEGDVLSCHFPKGSYSHVIHAAADASAALIAESPLVMLDTIVQGTRRVLDFAVAAKTTRFLFISSGAVYGKQPSELKQMPEDYSGAPDTASPQAAYGEAKRLAEVLSACYRREFGIEVIIARCFAFVGPYLPLDRHFAIGNFIADGLRGGPIVVIGDGTARRSYLYGADLAVWLWTLLCKGTAPYVFNVGSDEDYSIAEIAQVVARSFDQRIDVNIQGSASQSSPLDVYVPSIRRAKDVMGLKSNFDLAESLKRTLSWYRRA
jgi:nucleoside-diphosphate-sugar epimerase